MAKYQKPQDINTIWASDAGDNLVRPADDYINSGWEQVKPPFQYENWIQNQQSQFQAYINQFGIPEWDNVTEYQFENSFVQSSGKVFKCVRTNVGRDPSSAGNDIYWEETSLTRQATTTKAGILPIATYEQAKTGKSNNLIITPAVLKTILAAAGMGDEIINPAGAILMFAGAVPPTGYTECDGRELNRGDYPILFNSIGTRYGAGNGTTTFNLPDLRGEFVRGWDHGRGVDNARELGTSQDSQNKAHSHSGRTSSGGSHSHSGRTSSGGSHSHSYNDTANTGNSSFSQQSYNRPAITDQRTFSKTTGSSGSHSHSVNISSNGSHSHSLTTDNDGGGESRPRNIALMYVIKT